MDIKNFKFQKLPKEIWHDKNKETLVNSPKELDNSIMTNSFKKNADKQAWDRINTNFGHMFNDNDKDKFLNVFDKQPNKKNKKRFNLRGFI